MVYPNEVFEFYVSRKNKIKQKIFNTVGGKQSSVSKGNKHIVCPFLLNIYFFSDLNNKNVCHFYWFNVNHKSLKNHTHKKTSLSHWITLQLNFLFMNQSSSQVEYKLHKFRHFTVFTYELFLFQVGRHSNKTSRVGSLFT